MFCGLSGWGSEENTDFSDSNLWIFCAEWYFGKYSWRIFTSFHKRSLSGGHWDDLGTYPLPEPRKIYKKMDSCCRHGIFICEYDPVGDPAVAVQNWWTAFLRDLLVQCHGPFLCSLCCMFLPGIVSGREKRKQGKADDLSDRLLYFYDLSASYGSSWFPQPYGISGLAQCGDSWKITGKSGNGPVYDGNHGKHIRNFSFVICASWNSRQTYKKYTKIIQLLDKIVSLI